ncbi:MAG TPA: deoxyribose-phosphate aldolase [Candidatus Eisenbacteria bacterium]|uniref:Deoxyribose-phosphate aldolase n=1 Tax=Eiseniibacteriota bacterium TaxID=2212470 RepID=A0A7V2F3I5_UNCEI|nr:deoxyribose-phosphate aldolase [Candidatus Eisenbacteria bacterium]
MKLNALIDHTLLKPEATPADIERVCGEARRYDFYSVCVNTHYVPLAASGVEGTAIKVCSIAGFPLGALKAGDDRLVRDDIAGVVKAAAPALVKVIIEAALLDDDEKVRACGLAVDAGARFVKTSTGFGPPGANARDVEIMRRAVGPDIGVKASAGIRTAAFALELVEAGANRIGTSSGVSIMEEWKAMDRS